MKAAAAAHRHACSCCGRRTYRRVRRYPTLGQVDDRCAKCVARGYRPGVAVAEQQAGDMWAP